MPNYGRTDLEERTCLCGCGEKFKPLSPARKFLNARHKSDYHFKLNPEKKYVKKPKREDLLNCIGFYHAACKGDVKFAAINEIAEKYLPSVD